MARFLNIFIRGKRDGLSVWHPIATGRAGGWLAFVFVATALLVSISPGFYVRDATTDIGEVWRGADIKSPYRLVINDNELAEIRRAHIEQKHPKIFRYDPSVGHTAQRQLQSIFDTVRNADGDTTITRLHAQLQEKFRLNFKPETVMVLLANNGNPRVRSELTAILDHMYRSRGLTSQKNIFDPAHKEGRLAVLPRSEETDDGSTVSMINVLHYPGEAYGYLRNRFLPSLHNVPADVKTAYLDVVTALMRPNITYDADSTRAQKQAMLKSLNAARVIEAGEPIISAGQILRPWQQQALLQLVSNERSLNFLRLFGAAIFVALASVFVALYVRKFNADITFNAANVMMIALPIVFSIATGRLVLNYGGTGVAAAYAFPAGFIGMLAVIFFDARFALVLVTISSMLFGIAVGLDYEFILVSLVGGFTGVASLYTIKERKEVVLAGMRIALINAATILAVGLMTHPGTFSMNPAVAGILNGLACYVFTVAALPFFEMIFGVTTDVRLMELTSTRHPLLQLMEEKAAGSYQHSLNVAKLAESAAEDVGAHYLLVRAGAYFHDIGKMLKPKYYTENQTTPEERRIHSKLSPYMSNLIIKNHVKDGVELAREYHLPERVVDFIPQHHGTSLIKFFYAQALQRAEANDVVHEEEFRYPGPKPQSIEAGIVMLADTVEATVTAKFSGAVSVDEDDLRKLIRDSIFEKFHDGQFDECHMTFRDLHMIQESFVHALLSRYHQRVDYPKIEKRESRDATVKTERAPQPVAATRD